MLKFLKCSKPFHCQQILLPRVAWAVRIEQTHKASFYCRVEVVVEEIFSICQTKMLHQFFYRELIIANSFYDLAHGNIIRDQLVGYLSGQLVG